MLQIPLNIRVSSSSFENSSSIPEDSVFQINSSKNLGTVGLKAKSSALKPVSLSLSNTVIQEPNFIAAGPNHILMRLFLSVMP